MTSVLWPVPAHDRYPCCGVHATAKSHRTAIVPQPQRSLQELSPRERELFAVMAVHRRYALCRNGLDNCIVQSLRRDRGLDCVVIFASKLWHRQRQRKFRNSLRPVECVCSGTFDDLSKMCELRGTRGWLRRAGGGAHDAMRAGWKNSTS
jgi:hypothetical protein